MRSSYGIFFVSTFCACCALKCISWGLHSTYCGTFSFSFNLFTKWFSYLDTLYLVRHVWFLLFTLESVMTCTDCEVAKVNKKFVDIFLMWCAWQVLSCLGCVWVTVHGVGHQGDQGKQAHSNREGVNLDHQATLTHPSPLLICPLSLEKEMGEPAMGKVNLDCTSVNCTGNWPTSSSSRQDVGPLDGVQHHQLGGPQVWTTVIGIQGQWAQVRLSCMSFAVPVHTNTERTQSHPYWYWGVLLWAGWHAGVNMNATFDSPCPGFGLIWIFQETWSNWSTAGVNFALPWSPHHISLTNGLN